MNILNGNDLKAMFESGCNNLTSHKNDIDALNVFPVPDGDTGTNMSLTFNNGISEMNKSGSDSIPVITKTFSRGLLMGARGNSGVILSQIFRGFYQSVKEKDELNVTDIHEAFVKGKELAYKAVMRPVEGTILTVIRESVESCNKELQNNPEMEIEEYFDKLNEAAKVSLENTPELLPVLKEAHVVDSGGSGLVKVIEGFNAYLHGNPIEKSEESKQKEGMENRQDRAQRSCVAFRCVRCCCYDSGVCREQQHRQQTVRRGDPRADDRRQSDHQYSHRQ